MIVCEHENMEEVGLLFAYIGAPTEDSKIVYACTQCGILSVRY